MKFILLTSLLFTLTLQADYVKKTVGACASEEMFLELQEYSKEHVLEKGGLELEMWLMGHNCQVLTKKTAVEVLDYTGKKEEVLKVLLKKTGDVVYTTNKGIQIEQPGQKNILYKF